MKTDDKHISKELAQKIDKVAKEKQVKLPESEHKTKCSLGGFAHEHEPFSCGEKMCEYCQHIEDDKCEAYPAYDVAELGEMLPNIVEIKSVSIFKQSSTCSFAEPKGKFPMTLWLRFSKDGSNNFLVNYDSNEYYQVFWLDAETEAEARGKMYLYLLENELINND